MAESTSRSGLVRLVKGLLVRPHEDVRAALWFWGPLAVVCLVAGVLAAGNPVRSDAYFEVRKWLSLWISGVNVYGVPGLFVDYPPHALVFLSPLLLFPAQGGEVLFSCMNALVCIATAWVLVALTSGYAGISLSRRERLAYVLVLLVWSPTRVGIWNGQTSPVLILCCCLGLRLSSWSSVVAGLFMAIGTSKPHLAFGFVLLAAFARMWKMLAVAATAVLAAGTLYVVRVGETPGDVLRQYIDKLFSVYGGPTFLHAEVDVRPFFTDLIGVYGIAEPLYLATAAALGVALLWLCWRARNNINANVWVMASGLMWALAVFPFRRYGMLLLAPTVLLQLWRPGVSERRLMWLGVTIFIIAADLPFVARHIFMEYGPHAGLKFMPYVHYFNRLVTVACLVVAFRALTRAGRPQVPR